MFLFLFSQSKETVQLDILVENMGRVNFGLGINKQRKGELFHSFQGKFRNMAAQNIGFFWH